MILPAQDIISAYRAFDPDQPLSATDSRYVDLSKGRGDSSTIAEQLSRRIVRSENDSYSKYLVSGHRGCGKSTELLRTQKMLQDEQYFCVYMDIEEILDPADISYVDIFMGMIQALEKEFTKYSYQLSKQEVQAISEWLSKDITIEYIQQSDVKGGVEASAEAGASIPFFSKLMGKVAGDIKYGSTWRTTTREKIEKNAARFIELVNQLIISARNIVQAAGKKDLVFIIDGLEKIHYHTKGNTNSHADLFVNHADQLKAPQCHIIYTLPISLAYNSNLGNDFEDIQLLTMVNYTSDIGKAVLLKLIEKRVSILSIFENRSLVEQLIECSGGVARDLMRLMRLAINETADNDKIKQKEVDIAMVKLSRDYDRLINEPDVAYLEKVHSDQRAAAGSDAMNRLLLNRVVLEYQNGKRWAKIHPAAMKNQWLNDRLSNLP